MVLNKLRATGERVLGPWADRLAPGGADRLSWASLAAAFGAGAAFAFSDRAHSYLLLLGALLVLVNALLDALDGLVARKTGSASPAGNFLDHVIDRYADLAILSGLALSGFGDLRLGLLAITGVFLTSYLGTQAEAVGLSRDYGGILGRADRLVLLVAVPSAQFAVALFDLPLSSSFVGPFGHRMTITLVGLLLLVLGALGHVTAVQRFLRARRALLEKEGRRPPRSGPAGAPINGAAPEKAEPPRGP